MVKHEYEGYTVPCSSSLTETATKIDTLERVSAASISPDDFFHRFVVARKPCIVYGELTDSEWKNTLSNWRDNDYLKKRAGDVTVMVEKKGAAGYFGTGQPKIPMKFGELLDQLADKGDSGLYLTTQPETDEQKHLPEAPLCSAPVTKLLGDFPLRPNLLKSLVPSQYNVWMGTNQHGSSSGLHHDFHDNLYVLVRGTKRFTIFAPSDVERMYTVGQPVHVHKNGLINYGEFQTRSDGALPAEVAKYRVSVIGERIAAAQKSGDDAAVAAAEKELEDALDNMLTGGSTSHGKSDGGDGRFPDDGDGSDDGFDFFDPSTMHDDFDDVDLGDAAYDSDEIADNRVNSTKANVTAAAAAAAAPATSSSFSSSLSSSANTTDQTDEKAPSDPVNFCTVDVPSLQKHVRGGDNLAQVYAKYPKLRNAVPIVCEIKCGEMLYLPASFFHEVTSFGATDTGDDHTHMAFNFWFHPPSGKTADKPYADDYWQTQYDLSVAELMRTGASPGAGVPVKRKAVESETAAQDSVPSASKRSKTSDSHSK
jgi:Cupin-like domain